MFSIDWFLLMIIDIKYIEHNKYSIARKIEFEKYSYE